MKKEYSVAEQKEAFLKAMNEYTNKVDYHSEFNKNITENVTSTTEELEPVFSNIKDE